jgi:hypothetical protein
VVGADCAGMAGCVQGRSGGKGGVEALACNAVGRLASRLHVVSVS